jgi:hypothetical protein
MLHPTAWAQPTASVLAHTTSHVKYMHPKIYMYLGVVPALFAGLALVRAVRVVLDLACVSINGVCKSGIAPRHILRVSERKTKHNSGAARVHGVMNNTMPVRRKAEVVPRLHNRPRSLQAGRTMQCGLDYAGWSRAECRLVAGMYWPTCVVNTN